jgi:hypothetical protein
MIAIWLVINKRVSFELKRIGENGRLGRVGYGGPLLDLAHINFLNPTIIDLIIDLAEVSSKVHLI